jgi:hypothetical protein
MGLIVVAAIVFAEPLNMLHHHPHRPANSTNGTVA